MAVDALFPGLRVALVHDWLTGMRGGERCLEALLPLFPGAEIFTLLHIPGRVSPAIEARPIHTSYLNGPRWIHRRYRYLLPLFPGAIERLDLTDYDFVLSVSHCVAKGAIPRDGAPHLCYCLTPMRYVWDLYQTYFGTARANLVMRAVMPGVARRLRRWDVRSAQRVDAFLACSNHVRRRIERHYGWIATVAYPPVDVTRFSLGRERDDFYLIVSALEPYKRVDLAVAAFNELPRRLIVVGDGSEYGRLRQLAGGTVEFTGRLPDSDIATLLARCRAFVFPGEEDFGMTAVEAQAAGAPVIAYGCGGVTESVIGVGADGNERGEATGLFFTTQTVQALADAVRQFERLTFTPQAGRRSALRFSPEAFLVEMEHRVSRLLGVPRAE